MGVMLRNPVSLAAALCLAVILVGCGGTTVRVAAPKGVSIRVLVIDGAASITVTGAVGYKGAVKLSAAPGGVFVGRKLGGASVTLTPAKGMLRMGGKAYRGTLKVASADGKLRVVDTLPLEDYVVGIINGEISSKWHVDAVRAQSVAARTYAYVQMSKRKGEPFDVTNTTTDQVYAGVDAEDAASARAVRDTAGEVLFYEGAPVLALFHSNAGGRTEAAVDVWGGAYPYLRSVKSKFDKGAPNYMWEFSVTKKKLGEMLAAAGYGGGRGVGKVKKVKIVEKSPTGRVKLVTIKGSAGSVTIKGEELRKALGYATLRSTLFKVKNKWGGVLFKGRGSGHGVGMSQWGAKGMAEKGYGYKKILKHYYRGAKIKKVY